MDILLLSHVNPGFMTRKNHQILNIQYPNVQSHLYLIILGPNTPKTVVICIFIYIFIFIHQLFLIFVATWMVSDIAQDGATEPSPLPSVVTSKLVGGLNPSKTRCSPRTRMLTRMVMVQMSKHMDMQSRRTLFCNSLFEQSCT